MVDKPTEKPKPQPVPKEQKPKVPPVVIDPLLGGYAQKMETPAKKTRDK